jgi:Bacterial PH domain
MNSVTPIEFPAPWGRMLKGSSIFVILFFAALIVSDFFIFRAVKVPNWVHPTSAGIMIAVLLGCLPFIIRGYVVTAEGILIRRLWWNTVLPKADIIAVEAVPNAMRRSLRTCGNGGLFSFTGFYWNKQIGHYKAYVNDLNRTVVVRMKKRPTVLSPDDPEAFAQAVRALIAP